MHHVKEEKDMRYCINNANSSDKNTIKNKHKEVQMRITSDKRETCGTVSDGYNDARSANTNKITNKHKYTNTRKYR